MIDLGLSIGNCHILSRNLSVVHLDGVLKLLKDVLLLLYASGLVHNVSLEAFHLGSDILHLALDQLQLGLGLQSHVLDLTLVLIVLLLDFLELIVTILLDLLNGHLIASSELLQILHLLVNLSLLVLHLLLVLLFIIEDLVFVILLDLLDGSKEVLMISLLLSLKL